MKIKTPDYFRCPNCLERHPISEHIYRLFDILYLENSDDIHPFICNFCGQGMLVDGETMTAFLPEGPIKVDPLVIEELGRLYLTARAMQVWQIRKPEQN